MTCGWNVIFYFPSCYHPCRMNCILNLGVIVEKKHLFQDRSLTDTLRVKLWKQRPLGDFWWKLGNFSYSDSAAPKNISYFTILTLWTQQLITISENIVLSLILTLLFLHIIDALNWGNFKYSHKCIFLDRPM